MSDFDVTYLCKDKEFVFNDPNTWEYIIKHVQRVELEIVYNDQLYNEPVSEIYDSGIPDFVYREKIHFKPGKKVKRILNNLNETYDSVIHLNLIFWLKREFGAGRRNVKRRLVIMEN